MYGFYSACVEEDSLGGGGFPAVDMSLGLSMIVSNILEVQILQLCQYYGPGKDVGPLWARDYQ